MLISRGLIFITLLGFCSPILLKAGGDKYQITLELSPSIERLSPRDSQFQGIFGTKLSYNFGFEYKYFTSPGFSVSTGLHFQNKGFRNTIEYITSDTASNNFKPAVIIGSAFYLAAPFDLNFHAKLGESEKMEFVFTTGFTYGYLIRQTLNGKRVPNDIPNSALTALGAENGKKNINIFNKMFYGITISAGFVKYIKSKGVIIIQPKYTRGLSRALSKDAPVIADFIPKFDSFSIDIRAGYYFSKQIKNARKDF